MKKQHIFIIGSKGIPAKYGGFETFVEKLTKYRKNKFIQYHVACMSSDSEIFMYNDARCFNVKVPDIGPAKAIYYDIAALGKTIKYIKKNHLKNVKIYILACRIGPFIRHFKKQMIRLGVSLYVNPDGHEWLRDKWNILIKKYWKISESLMVKYADFLICDSKNIEKYIQTQYKRFHPKTAFIAYGADISKSALSNNDQYLLKWYRHHCIKPHEYYLVVGRFVPENNYETMIREFMKSNTKKDFVLITNVEKNSFYDRLKEETNFEEDSRIKFVGTVYDQELLKKIRENAYGYFHGHEVGGTNPSLLEALGSTTLNLLLDVGFNREVGGEAALYWKKNSGELSSLINNVEHLTAQTYNELGEKAKHRIEQYYNWSFIVNEYESKWVI